MNRCATPPSLCDSERRGTWAGYFLAAGVVMLSALSAGILLLVVGDMHQYQILLPVLLALNLLVLGNLLVMVWALLRLAAPPKSQPSTQASAEPDRSRPIPCQVRDPAA